MMNTEVFTTATLHIPPQHGKNGRYQRVPRYFTYKISLIHKVSVAEPDAEA
tara:strand:+ start:8 stop:160 length:153 start_codon:yes stop_codon:yes gene_type:complete